MTPPPPQYAPFARGENPFGAKKRTGNSSPPPPPLHDISLANDEKSSGGNKGTGDLLNPSVHYAPLPVARAHRAKKGAGDW